MTREDARQRRKQLAEAVREHGDVQRAAWEFGVSIPLVRRACWEFGVNYRAKGDKFVNRDDVFHELRVGAPPAEVARRHRVSEAHVARVLAEAVHGGAGQGESR